jgi:hypothetical protein
VQQTARRRWPPVILLFVVACNGSQTDRDSAAQAQPSCGWESPSHLTPDGIADVRIGLDVAALERRCRVVHDSVELNAEGGQQRVVRAQVGPAVVAAEIVNDTVWRLTVTDSRYRTADDLGVGTPLSRLLASSPSWAANGETGVFVGLKAHCGLSFRLDASAPDLPRPWFVPDVEALRKAPPNTQVDQVLVVGSKNCVGAR